MTSPTNEPEYQRRSAELNLEQSIADCEFLLSPVAFEHVGTLVNALPPLTRELTGKSNNAPPELLAVARMEDRAAVYGAIAGGLSQRRHRRALPSAWCRRRDRALFRASRALRSLRDVLAQSEIDPGLLGLAFGGVEREFRALLRLAWSDEPPDLPIRDGRAPFARYLLSASPRRLGWVKGGRPKAAWQSHTRAELKRIGIRGESLEELIEAAGLKDKSPVPKSRPRRPSRRRR